MTAKDIFRLVVRVIGIILITAALLDAVAVLLWLVHLPTRPGLTPLQIIAAAAVYFTCGLIVILAANPITQMVYGRDE